MLERFDEVFCAAQLDRINTITNASIDRVRLARNDDMTIFHNLQETAIERRS